MQVVTFYRIKLIESSKDSIPVVLRDMIQTKSSCEHAVSLSTDSQVGKVGHVHGQQEVREAGHSHHPQGGKAKEISVAGSSKKRNRKSKKIPEEPQTDDSHDRPTVRPTFIPLRPQCYVVSLSLCYYLIALKIE